MLLLTDINIQIKKIKNNITQSSSQTSDAYSNWATIKSDEKKLEMFKRKILRKLFGLKKNNKRKYKI